MAKKRVATIADRSDVTDSFFSSVREAAQNALGSSVSVGDEGGVVGLPLPALCLRYLFQSTVYPLSRIMQIAGEEGCAKSSFLYEMFRWHLIYGGGVVLAENENKDSPILRRSLLEWNEEWIQRTLIKPTYSLEEWQAVFTHFMTTASEAQDRKGGPGRTIPIIFAVDSIMATAPEAEIKQVMKDGWASRGYALAANLISRYMKIMPHLIRDYPFTIAGTNHLKPSTDARGLPTSNISGGKSVKFMETFEIEMKKSPGGTHIDRLDYSGLRIRFILRKNGVGATNKSITAEMLWWNELDQNGKSRQRTVWDWNTASIELLLSFENAKGKKTIFNQLRDITGIRAVSKSNRTAYSDLLGVPSSDPQPFRVIGQLLEGRPDILQEVYKVLGITEYDEFRPGLDYAAMQADAKRAAEIARTENLYAAPQGLPLTVSNTDVEMSPEEPDAEEAETDGEDDES